MEVAIPSLKNDFHFDSAATSPYVSAPSSPKRFGDPFDYYYHYSSAPSSPSRLASIFSSSNIPFSWEDKPGTPRSPVPAGTTTNDDDYDDDDDFAFDFSGRLDNGAPPPDLITADELFEKGKIRPLKPPPRLYAPSLDSPRSPKPRSPRGKPKSTSDGEGFDPFTAAMVEATRERGRERAAPSSQSPSITSSRSRKGSRSLSPMRSGVTGFFQKSSNRESTADRSTVASECLKTTSGRKWRLRDLLLFRSASEGRATGNKSKDPLRKYTILSSSSPNASPSSASLFSPSPVRRGGGEDSISSSFRSTDSGGSTRRGNVSAHEMHYMSNRAASEEMKKKTALPFNHRQGLFGCLRFNPAVHSIARGFHNSYSFGRRQ